MARQAGFEPATFAFEIANKLRGPYRPPQYRKVMLPMTVLRRMDCVLEPTKDEVLAEYKRLQAQGLEDEALNKVLAAKASKDRQQPLYNISSFTFEKLLGDPDDIAANLASYISGFSSGARQTFTPKTDENDSGWRVLLWDLQKENEEWAS